MLREELAQVQRGETPRRDMEAAINILHGTKTSLLRYRYSKLVNIYFSKSLVYYAELYAVKALPCRDGAFHMEAARGAGQPSVAFLRSQRSAARPDGRLRHAFLQLAGAMLAAVFPDTPFSDVHQLLEAQVSRGVTAVSKNLFDDRASAMKYHMNSTTELEMPDGSLVDRVKLKADRQPGWRCPLKPILSVDLRASRNIWILNVWPAC